MSYAQNLEAEGIDSQYLAIISPKIKLVDVWAPEGGSIYSQSFENGYISAVIVDGISLAAGTSQALSAGQFFYNTTNERLYVRLSDSSDPTLKFVVASFDYYCSTFDKHWYRNPTDDTTDQVYWEPVIARSPNLKQTTTDVLFGFMPVQTSSITLNNHDHFWEQFLYDASFNKAPIKIWHQLGGLDVGNLKLVYDGLMSDVVYNGTTVVIRCFDRQDVFNTEYRQTSGDSYFTVATFPQLDPNYINRPIRTVYGMVDGFTPVNIEYKREGFAGTDNRDWVVMNGQSGLMNITRTVVSGSTTTRTNLNNAVGLNIGDSVWLDRVSGVDEYVHITNINYGANWIEHATIASPMTSGDSVKRGFVGNVTIVQAEQVFRPHYGRDYLTGTFAGNTAGIILDPLLESVLGMPEFLSPNDRVFCRVYGRDNSVTLGGPAFGSNDSELGNLTNPVVIMVDLLKRLGVQDSEIDAPSFTALLSSHNRPVGFAIPSQAASDFPLYKDLLVGLMQSTLTKVFFNDDYLLEISPVAPISTVDKTVDDLELIKDSFSYQFSYSELLSEVNVEYLYKENPDDIGLRDIALVSQSRSAVAVFLHGINKSKTFRSLFLKQADAQDLADKLSYIFGDRIGRASISTKNRFFGTKINDRIEIDRTKLPGFVFDSETTRQRTFAVLETDKSLRSVTIELDDQKGIQDNALSW